MSNQIHQGENIIHSVSSRIYQGGNDISGVIIQGNLQVGDGASITFGGPNHEKQEMLNWMSPLPCEQRQNELVAKELKSPCTWFLKDPKYQGWRNSEENVTIWCSGNQRQEALSCYPILTKMAYNLAGSGKTFLVSNIVDDLLRFPKEQEHKHEGKENKQIGVSYVYCDHKNQEGQTAEKLVASLTNQLARQYYNWRLAFPAEVKVLYNKEKDKKKDLTLKDHISLFLSLVKYFSKVFVVIDALDECSNSDRGRNIFISALQGLRSSVRMLVTSRNLDYIKEEFKDAVQVDIRADIGDVTVYLENYMKRRVSYGVHLFQDSQLQNEIASLISKNCDGIFLLARLQIDYLARKTNVRDIREALRSLPTTLDELYSVAIGRIKAQIGEHSKLAMKVLRWIFFAKRPLKIEELQDALSVRKGDAAIDKDGFEDPQILTGVCVGLVTLDSTTRVIKLVHFTFNEYLKARCTEFFPGAQTEITTICLTYLSFNIFSQEGCCPDDNSMENRLCRYPFLEYAAQHWGDHARGDPEKNVEIKKLALGLLREQDQEHHHGENRKSNSKLLCSTTQAMYVPKHQLRYSGYSQSFPKRTTGLQIASSFGLRGIAQLLLEGDANINVNAKDENEQTALHRAASHGNGAVARLLIENNADINMGDYYMSTPLHLAAESGHESVVQLLLDRGADFNTEDWFKRRPLHKAAMSGKKALTELLVKEGADAKDKDQHGQTALHLAAIGGHEEVVGLLLNWADINETDKSGQTALHLAVEAKNSVLAQLLVDNEADVGIKDNYGQTALHLAAENGDAVIAEILINKGADVNLNDWDYHTPLYLAAAEGHKSVVELLNRSGADVTTGDTYGETPLHVAAKFGHERVVQLLLEENIPPDIEDNDGRMPLHLALENGHEKVVYQLLERHL